MDEDTFNKKLRELIREIASPPADKQKQLAPLVEETKSRHNEIKENVDKVTKSLSDLRICIKYLLFDLEATRRERDRLKNIVDNQPPKDADDDEPNKAEGEM
ncbi:MAG: transcriptional regulator [Chloroflexi bacterium]|nr:MAG: transcriptional regulator [Chloroflexota bacterium]